MKNTPERIELPKNKYGMTAIHVAQSDFMETLAEEGFIDSEHCLKPENAKYIQKILDKFCEKVAESMMKKAPCAAGDARACAKRIADIIFEVSGQLIIGDQMRDGMIAEIQSYAEKYAEAELAKAKAVIAELVDVIGDLMSKSDTPAQYGQSVAKAEKALQAAQELEV